MSNIVQFGSIWSNLVQSGSIWFNLVQSCPILSCLVQSCSIVFNLVQSWSIFFLLLSGVYGGNYGANYRLYKFQGDRFDPCNSNMIKKLSNMQFELHDGNGGTCSLSEDLIISVRGMKSRRNGNFKRYVTYYVSLHPALQWLTKIALGTIHILREHVCGLFGPHPPTHLISISPYQSWISRRILWKHLGKIFHSK